MKASDYIVRFLEAQGVECVFGYQGGMITHLVDSLSRSEKVRFIPCYHEQSAAFAAEGYARVTGRIGVCITTSGPGATNTITSIGNAYFDSVPVLYITGQVNTYEYKYDSRIRQKGFQETDIVSIVSPITKRAFMADVPFRLPEDLAAAVRCMLTPRKGPVLIDLPMDVQRTDVDAPAEIPVVRGDDPPPADSDSADAILSEIRAANRPLVVCGGGIAGLERSVSSFLRRSGFPYAVTLMGKGLVDEDVQACVGMIGSYGNRCANMVLAEADVVLGLGTRFDLRQTGNRRSPILSGKRFLRIDVDQEEVDGNRLPDQRVYLGGLKTWLARESAAPAFFRGEAWANRIAELKAVMPQQEDVRRFAENRLPYDVLSIVAATAPDDAVFVVDIGQNQMWAAQTIRTKSCQSFLTSGGMAPMGYALPAAVGVAFADPSRQVICIVGDGGLHMSLQSLSLISQYHLPITVILLNNHALGMITQFQRLYFDGNLAGTVAEGGYGTPDFIGIARACGLECESIHTAQGLDMRKLSGKMVEVRIDGLTNVVPKLEYDHGLDDMTPQWEDPG